MSNTISDIVSGSFILVEVVVRSKAFVAKDQSATTETIDNNHAVSDAGSFQKNLFASANAELRALKKAGAACRTYLYNNTAPYDTGAGSLQKGARLLASTASMEFYQGFGVLEVAYTNALNDFKAVYDERKAQALSNLGSMADSKQYPDVSELDDYFGVELIPSPVPQSGQLPASLPTSVMETASAKMAQGTMDKMNNALADTRERLGAELVRMAGVFQRHSIGEKTKLYGSLMDNMRNVTDLLDATNVTGDLTLTAVVQDIRNKLLPPNRTIDDYKMSITLAGDAATAATQIGNMLNTAPSLVAAPTPLTSATVVADSLMDVVDQLPTLDEVKEELTNHNSAAPIEPPVPPTLDVTIPEEDGSNTTEPQFPDADDMFG
jgi:hypothetical protein